MAVTSMVPSVRRGNLQLDWRCPTIRDKQFSMDGRDISDLRSEKSNATGARAERGAVQNQPRNLCGGGGALLEASVS